MKSSIITKQPTSNPVNEQPIKNEIATLGNIVAQSRENVAEMINNVNQKIAEINENSKNRLTTNNLQNTTESQRIGQLNKEIESITVLGNLKKKLTDELEKCDKLISSINNVQRNQYDNARVTKRDIFQCCVTCCLTCAVCGPIVGSVLGYVNGNDNLNRTYNRAVEDSTGSQSLTRAAENLAAGVRDNKVAFGAGITGALGLPLFGVNSFNKLVTNSIKSAANNIYYLCSGADYNPQYALPHGEKQPAYFKLLTEVMNDLDPKQRENLLAEIRNNNITTHDLEQNIQITHDNFNNFTARATLINACRAMGIEPSQNLLKAIEHSPVTRQPEDIRITTMF